MGPSFGDVASKTMRSSPSASTTLPISLRGILALQVEFFMVDHEHEGAVLKGGLGAAQNLVGG